MVVSEMNDRLSPKKAPPTTTAVIMGREHPVCWATPRATGVRATMVPTEVPTLREMKQAARNSPGSSQLSGSTCRVSTTVASTAPMAFALWAKAPARMKIQIMSIMLRFPAPSEKWEMRCSRGMPRVMATAYTELTRKATVMGTL